MFERTQAHSPERDLWQEVLLRTIEDAVIGPCRIGSRTSRIRICTEARRYLQKPSADLVEVCTLAGIEPEALMDRMKMKIAAAPSVEELIDDARSTRAQLTKTAEKALAPRRDGPVTYTHEGETLTIPQWAARTGISRSAIAQRIARGWSIEDTLTISGARGARMARKAIRRTAKPRSWNVADVFTHEGETLTLAQWAERTGIKKGTLYKRIMLSGWSMEDALTGGDMRRKTGCQVAP